MPVKEKTQKRKEVRIQPLGNRILVEPLGEEEKTNGGIVIPDAAKEKQQRGRVVRVGQGKLSDEGKLIPTQVRIGDTVLFAKYSGTDLKIEGKELLMISEDDCLGIVR